MRGVCRCGCRRGIYADNVPWGGGDKLLGKEAGLLVKINRSSPGCSHGTRVKRVTSHCGEGTRGGGARVVTWLLPYVD